MVVCAEQFYQGLWEYSINVQTSGMAEQPNLKRVQQCINELNDLIVLFKPDPACQVKEVNRQQSTLSWRLYCDTSGGVYRGKADFSRANRLMNGKVDLRSSIPGVGEILVTTYRAKGVYKGPC
jgi:hypothetical protein